MRVLVVGASGAVGRPLLSKLVDAGHDVVAAARRTPHDVPAGVTARSLDLLDRVGVYALMSQLQPQAVINQATALSGLGNNMRRFDRDFATTNRLRVEGTRSLIGAGERMPEPPRLVVQSFCGWPWAPVGDLVKSEADPLDPDPAPVFRRTIAAITEMEDMIEDHAIGVALRYGALYGPGTSLTVGGAQIEAVRKRLFPVVGDGGATWSFLHVEDAADAAVAALTRGRGVYNVVDDHPAPIEIWLREIAVLVDAPEPRRIPTWLAGLVGGDGLVHLMTRARGSSNAKARLELDWSPAHPDWRAGFAADLRSATAAVNSR